MNNELKLILHNAHRHPQLHRHAGLALGDPSGVLLEHRKHFLLVRNRFAVQQPTLDLIHLTPGMAKIMLHHQHRQYRRSIALLQLRNRRLRVIRDQPAVLNIVFHLACVVPPTRVAHPVETLPYPSFQMFVLPPAVQTAFLRRPPRLPNHTTHRIIQQPYIRGVVDIGLHHETVTAPAQWRARLFSRHLVTALHYYLANLRQQLRTQKRHIVDQRLQLVITRLVFSETVPVPQHLPYRLVLIRKLLQSVEIATQPLLQNRKNEYPPQVHTWTTHFQINTRANLFE